MKLVRFGDKGHEQAGIIDANKILRDVSAFTPDWTGATLSNDILVQLKNKPVSGFPIVKGKPRLGPPVGNVGKIIVGKIIGCALTYGKHAQEAGLETPKEPMFMLTSRTAINGPFDDVVIPRGGTELDWEAELVVVLGKGGSYIPVEKAMEHVAGYCVGNDVSERQFQLERGTQWTKGKSADTLKPFGPWLVTKDEIPNPNTLDISVKINGQTRQSSNTGDITQSTTANLAMDKAANLFGRAPDILINNAGTILRKTAQDTSDAEWADVMAVNVTGVFNASRAFARTANNDGAIVNVSSTCGQVGAAGLAAYCTSKGAVDQLTRAMALELAPRQITVNAVALGAINSPMLFSKHSDPKLAETVKDRNIANIPLGTIAEPEEIARSILFLARERHITGTILSVDGGYTAL